MVHASSAAFTSNDQAAEELAIVRQLRAWGASIAIADFRLPAIGYAHIRQRPAEKVARAVQQAVADVKQSWGNDWVPKLVDSKNADCQVDLAAFYGVNLIWPQFFGVICSSKTASSTRPVS